MTEDELKDGAIVIVDSCEYKLKRHAGASCGGCSFDSGGNTGCTKPNDILCWELDRFYIYIKQES